MAYIIKMPKLGLEMEQGTVLEWYVDPGDEVAEGDILVEVESEKSIGEVDAREDGVVRRVYIEEEESVPPGTPIGILAPADADISDLEAEVEAELGDDVSEAADESGSGGEPASADTVGEDGQAAAAVVESTSAAGGGGEQNVSPRAKKRAEELGVDLSTVEGTGFEGAVTEDDVEAAAEAAEDATEDLEAKASPRAKARAEELGVDLSTVEGTGFEGAITEGDVEAAAEAATEAASTATSDGVQVAAGADAARYRQTTAVVDPAAGEELFGTMEAVRTAFEERVTMTDLLVVVASAALADQPVLNGTYAESTHQVHEAQHIAVVSGNDPEQTVIENADERSLTAVVEARQDGEASDADVTFTLANAAEASTDGRLVNPPAVAALTVGATGQRAVPDGDGVDLQPLVTTRLTYDTRAVGESEALAFLDAFAERARTVPGLVLNSYRGTE